MQIASNLLAVAKDSPNRNRRTLVWTVVKLQSPIFNNDGAQSLKPNPSTLDIKELCMTEATDLTSAAINRHSDVNDIWNIPEQVVDFGIGHIKRQVTDIESSGGSGSIGFRNEVEVRVSCDNAPAFQNTHMYCIPGVRCGFNGAELDVGNSNKRAYR